MTALLTQFKRGKMYRDERIYALFKKEMARGSDKMAAYESIAERFSLTPAYIGKICRQMSR